MNFIPKRCWIIVLLLIGTLSAIAQNSSRSDSLIRKYQNEDQLTYEDRFNLALDISTFTNDTRVRLTYAQLALENAQELNNDKYIGGAYLMLGQSFSMLGNYPRALENLMQSVDHYKNAGFEAGVGAAYTAIGTLYNEQKNYTTATKYYKQSIDVQRNIGHELTLAASLCNLGELYRRTAQYDSAKVYLLESMKLYQENNNKRGVAYCMANVGLVEGALGKRELAVEYMNESREMLEDLNDTSPIGFFNLYLSDIFHEEGNTKEALEYALAALEIGESEDYSPLIRDANKKISTFYAALGDLGTAYDYLSAYEVIRDSLNNESTIQRLADLRTELEVSQKQREVDYLERIRKSQQSIGFALIVILILISALTYVIYRNFRQKSKLSKMLEAQNEKLTEQHEELSELNYTKDKLFSIVSHDLRGPIGAITGISMLIRSNIDEKDELLEIAGYMEESSEKLRTMLDNLLVWAMNQQGRMPIKPEMIHLKEITSELKGVFSPMARSKKIDLKDRVDDEIRVWADKNSLTTIIRNLVNNALKFTNPGGQVIIESEKNDNNALIHVKDTGVGIPKDKLKTLFEFKDNKSTFGTKNEKGLGLGLSMAFEFAEKNNGSIKVDSEEGKGTTFTVKMPLNENINNITEIKSENR